ncbi:winged helix-turn-helix transcriptional regulator [Yersinia enterocolitica]
MSVESALALNPIAERILAAITVNPTITIVEMANELKVSSRTIERNIKQLQ